MMAGLALSSENVEPRVYNFLPEWRLIHVRLPDEYSLQDFRRDQFGIRNDPEFNPGFDILLDQSDLKTANIGLASFIAWKDSFLESRKAVLHPIRIAVLAQTDFSYGMGRMIQTTFSGAPKCEVEVFETVAEAFAFLELPEEAMLKMGYGLS